MDLVAEGLCVTADMPMVFGSTLVLFSLLFSGLGVTFTG